jgi:peptidoglycan/LPS O-acetylase OafA/YrhL
MKAWGRRIGYGIILWALLYAAAIPLLPLAQNSEAAFKATIFCIASIVGGIFVTLYFSSVERDFLKEAITLAITWIIVNWALDVVALLPFTHQTIPQYFFEIGIEYLGMLGTILPVGYLLDQKTQTKR